MGVGEQNDKTREDVEELKRQWVRDPAWDIETTEGFEAYHDELLAYSNECWASWKAEVKQETHFADLIGKPDPTWGRNHADTLVYPLVPLNFQGLVYVREFDDDPAIYVVCGYNDAPDTITQAVDALGVTIREGHPELTLGLPGPIVQQNEKSHYWWYGFTIARLLTEAEMERGRLFRVESMYKGGGQREQAAFERRVSATLGLAQNGVRWVISGVTENEYNLTVCLQRVDQDA